MLNKVEESTNTDRISFRNVISALEEHKFSKLICGAANTNKLQIERLAIVYSLAGINVIDVSPSLEIYQSALNGIKKAAEIHKNDPDLFPDYNRPMIMVSVNLDDDPHFRKAQIDFTKCVNCNDCTNCTSVCPAGALYRDSESLKLNIDSCYGCGRCREICKYQAINLINIENISNIENMNIFNYINNKKDFSETLKAIELHINNTSIDKLKNFLKNNSGLINSIPLISLSINASIFNANELVEFANYATELINKKIIIQIDGGPMSGSNLASSGLQSIAAAGLLIDSNIDAYIQIAGGTNHLTKNYLKLFNLKISGIGYGTFARKIILSYIDGFNEAEFIKNLKKCVNITTNLVNNYSDSLKHGV